MLRVWWSCCCGGSLGVGLKVGSEVQMKWRIAEEKNVQWRDYAFFEKALYCLRKWYEAGTCLKKRSRLQAWTRRCMSRIISHDGMTCIAGIYMSVTRYRMGFMTPSLLLGAEHAVTATIRSISALKSM